MLHALLFLRRRRCSAYRYLTEYLSAVATHYRTAEPLRYTQCQFGFPDTRRTHYEQKSLHAGALKHGSVVKAEILETLVVDIPKIQLVFKLVIEHEIIVAALASDTG